ncbi:unnamed protein product [Peronospora belbahrii]|uniref:RRM domain-containing protein n=1 Tax=Peronospora belbahrii TaxID=622444 RepID=A0AAU9LMK0_9STRA|nr:unnamed protein product [Peronospora belbahrii]CAH0521659.1 unnamed protein product [Peronospora belbahrii]
MGDSAAALWESELLRARQWLKSRHKDKQEESEWLFQRVKMHIGFKDHQQSLQSQAVASEDEDDTALAFLGDIDASDMSTLLQAEAANIAAAVPLLEIVPPVKSHMPNARDLMIPLEMPVNLISPRLNSKSVSTLQLDPKSATTTDAGVTLVTEADVQELMQELALDTIHLKQFDIDEEKTEESTPPHILKNYGGVNTTANNEAKQFKYMPQVSLKSPQSPEKKKADSIATMQEDDVTDEMLSWVSGYRDPEVIRRKENMRKKRKNTRWYGMASEEESRQVLMQVEKITHDSKDNSGSDDNSSSDYLPVEEDDNSGPDDNEEIVFLSDANVDSDEERGKWKRKRLHQARGSLTKKRPHSRKSIVTRKKVVEQSVIRRNRDNLQKVQLEASSAGIKAKRNLGAGERALTEAHPKSTSSQPIEYRSYKDEKAETNNRNSVAEMVDHTSTISHGADCASSNATEPEQLKVLINLRDSPLKETNSSNMQQDRGLASDLSKAAPVFTCSEAAIGDRTCESVRIVCGSIESFGSPTANEKANSDDADLSKAMTLKGTELLRHNQEQRNEASTASTTEVVIGNYSAAQLDDAAVNATIVYKRTHGELKQSVEVSDDDVSEAETEILEDDELDTDNLELELSAESDGRSSIPMDQKESSMGAQKDALDNTDGEIKTETTVRHDQHSSADSKQEASNDQKEDKVTASMTGVQQFFDFVPLKLKSKVKTVSSIAPKPLPFHSYTVTHSKAGNSYVESQSAKSKKTGVVPSTPSLGSNGLRPSQKPIATITTTKGKYLSTRRCIKVLSDTPDAKRQPKRQYTMVATEKTRNSGIHVLDDEPLAILAKELSQNLEDTPQTRYLSYGGAKKAEEPPSYIAETPRLVPKSRFGGGLQSSSSAVQTSSVASNGQHSQMIDKTVIRGGYRRDPQINIYDALHLDRQESAIDVCEKTDYKRPSRFKTMQAEAARNGTPMVKSQLKDKDWEKMPIPRKRKQARQADEDALLQPSSTRDQGSKSDAGKSRNKDRKKKSASSNKSSSYYGPQAFQLVTSSKHDLPSRGQCSRERSSCRRENDRKRKQSLSSPSRDRNHYDRKRKSSDGYRRRGSSRSRSHSPSPRSRDYRNNRKRHRSRSKSRSREKSSERERRRSDQTSPTDRDRDCHRKTNSKKKRVSFSPEYRDSSKKERLAKPPKLVEVCQNGKNKTGDIDRFTKKKKIFHSTVAPSSLNALTTLDDEEDNLFISDSDDDENALIMEVEDIRIDLDSVPVDEALITRQVYVTGLNPTVCAEQIEEDFARFGVAVDRETGFPAIELFACQRNYLGRGDACVTFETEEGAQEAVEELNLKNVKNSMIQVRRMDIHTQRILTLQFRAVRETWKCTKTQCRANVSVWNAKCDKCGRKRVYGPSNIKIGADSWLCSLCFTANESFAASCHGCMESLPEVDRSTFYIPPDPSRLY